MDKIYDMSGKVVLITGGSRGLGRAMALGFASQGADIVIASRRLESCEEAAREVEALGGRALAVAAHVGHWDELDALVAKTIATFGKIDVLINNAGMSPLYHSLEQISEELFDKVIGVNLKGPFRLSAVVGKHMKEQGSGAIINISSTASVTASPNAEPYGAAKAGLNALTRSFAYSLGPEVRVNCIMAGPFLTDISKAWDLEAFKKRAEITIPLKRGGEPDEIVGAALYLASDFASFTTGAVLAVDGGAH